MASLTTYYSEHKAVDGMTIPTRIVAYRDGELFLDTTIRKLELLESVDPALFMKPEDE